MFKYLGKRLVTYIVMGFIATSAAYLLAVSFFRPGQSLENMANGKRRTPEEVASMLRSLGLDPTLHPLQRYFQWLKNVVFHFDWGMSPNGQSVNFEFANRMWISFWLQILATVLTIVIGVALGVWSAARQYKASDRIITGYSYLTFILPVPVFYILVQLGFITLNRTFGWSIPVTDVHDPTVTEFWPALLDYAAHYFVPALALTAYGWAGYQVGQRQYLLDNINADFVRTARATGLTRLQAIRKHALRVSFIPVAQSIAYTIPNLFTGAFYAESIFNWPGLGKWSIGAITGNDVNVAAVSVAYAAAVFAIGAIMADFATTLIDPRVRMS